MLVWLDGDAEVKVCVEGLDVFGSVGFCFVGDEDGVVGCGVDGRGDGGDGGRAAEDLPPLPRRCREERDKTRGDTMRGDESNCYATAGHAMSYSDKGGCVDWCQWQYLRKDSQRGLLTCELVP